MDLIALYGAVLATGIAGWEIWKFVSSRREQAAERRKVAVYFGIPIIHTKLPKFGEMVVFPLCVSNMGRQSVIVARVEMRDVEERSVFYPGAYPEPQATFGIAAERLLPRRLEPGETLELPQFTLAAFRSRPSDVVAIDSEGNEHLMPQPLIDRQMEDVKRLQEKTKKRREGIKSGSPS